MGNNGVNSWLTLAAVCTVAFQLHCNLYSKNATRARQFSVRIALKMKSIFHSGHSGPALVCL